MAVQTLRFSRRRPLSPPSLPWPREGPVQLSKERIFVLRIASVAWKRGYFFILEPEQCERLIPRFQIPRFLEN